MNILERLLQEVDAITEQQLEVAAHLMDDPEPKDTPHGTVQNPFTLRLWALATDYRRRSHLAKHAAIFDVRSKRERHLMEKDAAHLESMSDTLRDLAWASMREEIPQAWANEQTAVGLRSGFLLVSYDDEPEVTTHVTSIPLPLESLKQLGQSLNKMMRDSSSLDPEPETPKKKPQ